MPVYDKRSLQDTIQCRRHKVELHGDKVYITVCEDDNGTPVEIFASAPVEWRHGEERMSMLESLNRVISLSFRCGVDPTEIIRQLRKGSSGREYPAIAADVIDSCLSLRTENKDEEHAVATAAPVSAKSGLARCPCGQTPKSLSIDPHGDSKWFLTVPSCCGEWLIEFRSGYNKPDSEEAMELAIQAWNSAPRNQ